MAQPIGATSKLRKYRTLIVLVAILVVIGMWWLFRPERLFLNQQVNETAPAGLADLQPVFTGSLHPIPGGNEIEGRANVVKDGTKFKLEIANLKSKTANSFTIALAPTAESSAGAHTLGEITVAGHERLDIPAGVDPASDKAVLLMNANQIVATATLEAF